MNAETKQKIEGFRKSQKLGRLPKEEWPSFHDHIEKCVKDGLITQETVDKIAGIK